LLVGQHAWLFSVLDSKTIAYSTDNEEYAKSSEDRGIHSQLCESNCP
jgi:hypothetical protein